ENANVERFRRRRPAGRGFDDIDLEAFAGRGERQAHGTAADHDEPRAHADGLPRIMRSASMRRAGGKRSSAASPNPRPQVGRVRASVKAETSQSVKAMPRDASRRRAE